MLQAKNSKKQGDIGLGRAIAWFAANGYTVSIPLTDSQDYDLIVDNGSIFRVQIKTTSYKLGNAFKIWTTVKGGNRSYNTIKKFDSTKVELLFIVTDDDIQYLIPTCVIGNKSSISLGKLYENYIVG